jgi:hypothetical protein
MAYAGAKPRVALSAKSLRSMFLARSSHGIFSAWRHSPPMHNVRKLDGLRRHAATTPLRVENGPIEIFWHADSGTIGEPLRICSPYTGCTLRRRAQSSVTLRAAARQTRALFRIFSHASICNAATDSTWVDWLSDDSWCTTLQGGPTDRSFLDVFSGKEGQCRVWKRDAQCVRRSCGNAGMGGKRIRLNRDNFGSRFQENGGETKDLELSREAVIN